MIDSSDSGELTLRKGNSFATSFFHRMKESKVLVINLTGSITELCRHLVLSGINLEIAEESIIVDQESSQAEFLIDPVLDQGKPVSNDYLLTDTPHS
jgi:molybdopterin/thiamine biosynthesis adenylyltransferase